MFLILRETPDGEPIFATADPRIIDAVLRALTELARPAELRRALGDQPEQPALRLVDSHGGDDVDDGKGGEGDLCR